jgi:hypothetical protein
LSCRWQTGSLGTIYVGFFTVGAYHHLISHYYTDILPQIKYQLPSKLYNRHQPVRQPVCIRNDWNRSSLLQRASSGASKYPLPRRSRAATRLSSSYTHPCFGSRSKNLCGSRLYLQADQLRSYPSKHEGLQRNVRRESSQNSTSDSGLESGSQPHHIAASPALGRPHSSIHQEQLRDNDPGSQKRRSKLSSQN